MSMHYQPTSLIGASNASAASPFLPPIKFARAAGGIMTHDYLSSKPKKQVKEMIKILWPEKKRFIKLPFGFKFNTRDRCVVCGTHKRWEADDPMRPTIPLHKVRKGYPMRGTYCDKHSGLHRQYEMLEQQIIADEHGLEFSSYLPKPKMPKMLQSGPLTTLRQNDVESLAAIGWTIRPPQMNTESPEIELFRLTRENQVINSRITTLMTMGTKVVPQEIEKIEEET